MKIVLSLILVTIGLVAARGAWEQSGRHECETHTDCSPVMNCYTDFKCRDPCIESNDCGAGSVCKIVDRSPYCYCPPNFTGDAKKKCTPVIPRYDRGRGRNY